MKSTSAAVTVRLLPAVHWMLLIFVLSAQHKRPGPAPQPVAVPQAPGVSPQPAQDLFNILGHLVLYAVLAACLWWSLGLLTRLKWWGRVAFAFIGTMAYAVTDEWHQSYVANREASQFDLQVNAVGALAGLTVVLVMVRIARRTRATW